VTGLVEQAVKIWVDGGWAMWPLAANSLIVFALGSAVWLRLRARGHRSVAESVWREWVDDPSRGKGPIGSLIRFAMERSTLDDVAVRFSELRATELHPFERDIKFMKRAVSTAPLLGLLGTVTGMLTTFDALSSGSGGQKTMDMVAGGISEALITTETGLVIALPGLFLQYHLSRGKDRYAAFLAHLETVCTQRLYRVRREAA
jgi:biopolymer transport protein ExbB